MAGDQSGEHADDHRQHHAGEVVEGEFGGAPLPLQDISDHIVEVEEQRQPQHISRGVVAGHEDKGDKPPQLALGDGAPAEGQKTDRLIAREDGQQIDQDAANDDELHQIGDAEARVLVGKAVHGGTEFSQGNPSKTRINALIIPVRVGKVTYNL